MLERHRSVGVWVKCEKPVLTLFGWSFLTLTDGYMWPIELKIYHSIRQATDFQTSYLQNYNPLRTGLGRCAFVSVNLAEPDLRGASLELETLKGVDLQGADVWLCNLDSANFATPIKRVAGWRRTWSQSPTTFDIKRYHNFNFINSFGKYGLGPITG